MEDEILNKKIDERIKKALNEFSRNSGFTIRKVTDTPTDALATVNRKYANLNGVVADRPKSSVATIGQSYLATDTGIPMRYTAEGWRNGVGSIVALNN